MKLKKRGRWQRWVYGGRVFVAAVLVVIALPTVTLGCSNALAEADALLIQGDLAGAEGLYREILLEKPAAIDALSGLAVVLMLQQRWEEAALVQERVVAADAEDVQTRVELGFNYMNHQGRPGDAVRVLREAAELSGTAQHLTFLAQAYREAGRLAEAEHSARQAIELDPEYRHSYAVLIGILKQSGRHDEAAEIEVPAAGTTETVDAAQPAP